MAPDAPPPAETLDESGKQRSGPVLLGNTSSRELVGFPGMATLSLMTGSPAAVASPSRRASGDAPMSPGSSARGRRALAQLSSRMIDLGRRLRAASRGQHSSLSLSQSNPESSRRRSEPGGESEAGTNEWDDEAAVGVEPRAASGTLRPKRSPGGTHQEGAADGAERQRLQREQERSLQMQKRQRMAAYLQSIAAAAHPGVPRPQRPPAAAAAAAGAAATAAAGVAAAGAALDSPRAASPGAALALGRVGSGGVRSVSIGVQTDDSELLLRAGSGAYSSIPRRTSSEGYGSRRLQRLREEEEVEPATPAAAALSTAVAPSSDGYDADLAAQYVAAMAAAAGAGAAAAVGSGPAPPSEARRQAPAGGGDEDVASQYMAAMAAAAGAGAVPAAAAAAQQAPGGGGDANVAAQYMAAMAAAAAAGGAAGPPPRSFKWQQEASHAPNSGMSTIDSDLAAQYLMAMQAAAVGSSPIPPHASPPPLAQPRGQADGLSGHTPRATPLQHPPLRRSISSASPNAASPLEQLAYQQQQAASARLASLTPGSLPYSQGVSTGALLVLCWCWRAALRAAPSGGHQGVAGRDPTSGALPLQPSNAPVLRRLAILPACFLSCSGRRPVAAGSGCGCHRLRGAQLWQAAGRRCVRLACVCFCSEVLCPSRSRSWPRSSEPACLLCAPTVVRVCGRRERGTRLSSGLPSASVCRRGGRGVCGLVPGVARSGEEV